MYSATLVAKSEQVKYPLSIDKALFDVAKEHAENNYSTFPKYVKMLLEQDLQAKGKWPVK